MSWINRQSNINLKTGSLIDVSLINSMSSRLIKVVISSLLTETLIVSSSYHIFAGIYSLKSIIPGIDHHLKHPKHLSVMMCWACIYSFKHKNKLLSRKKESFEGSEPLRTITWKIDKANRSLPYYLLYKRKVSSMMDGSL